MTFEEARAWLESSGGERDMRAVYDSSNEALENAEATLAEISAFGSANTSLLQGLIRAHERAFETLNDAVHDVVRGRVSDARALSQSFAEFDVTLVALEDGESAYGALVRANFANVVAGLSGAFVAYQTRMRRRCRELGPDLERLNELLLQLATDVENARGRRAITHTITVGTRILGRIGGPAARLPLFVADKALKQLVKYVLRPTGPSPVEAAYRWAATDAENLSNDSNAVVDALTTVLNTLTATQGIVVAEERLSRFRRMMPAMQRDLRDLRRFVAREMQSLDVARALYDGAVRTYDQEMARARSSAPGRRALVRTFASIRGSAPRSGI